MLANLTTPFLGVVATAAVGRLGEPYLLGGVAIAQHLLQPCNDLLKAVDLALRPHSTMIGGCTTPVSLSECKKGALVVQFTCGRSHPGKVFFEHL